MIRFGIRHLIVGTTIVAFVLVAILSVRSVVVPRNVVAVDHPNGTRLRVVQQFEYSGDLFNTSIYFDDGDGQWRWYYFDHDDSYWGHASADVAGSEIRVASPGRNILFDTDSGKCTVSNGEVGIRTVGKSETIKALPGELANIELR